MAAHSHGCQHKTSTVPRAIAEVLMCFVLYGGCKSRTSSITPVARKRGRVR